MSDTPAAATVDVSAIPAGALPPGVDAATYVAQKTGAQLSEPTLQTPADRLAAERPANVPEKFWDATNKRVNTDALLKSYSELEKMKSKPAEAAPEAAAEEPAPQDPNKATIEKPAEEGEKPAEEAKPEAAPVSTLIEQLTSKYTDGTLADADFTAAEAAGIPKSVVETYFAGLKALEGAQMLSLETAAGGKDALTAARTWAAKGLNDAELTFYNENVAKPETAEMAVKWLADKYKTANPSEGSLVTNGQPSATPQGDVFRSPAEVTAAMSDPKYRTDPAFRQAVAEKLQRSRAAGTYQTNAQFFRG